MSVAVIDASALIALLEGEVGADVVDTEIEGAMIAAVNFGEVAQHQYKKGRSRSDVEKLADALQLDVHTVDFALVLDAADIREVGRAASLSQADCVCLALAKGQKALALTADRKWAEVAGQLGIEVRLIR